MFCWYPVSYTHLDVYKRQVSYRKPVFLTNVFSPIWKTWTLVSAPEKWVTKTSSVQKPMFFIMEAEQPVQNILRWKCICLQEITSGSGRKICLYSKDWSKPLFFSLGQLQNTFTFAAFILEASIQKVFWKESKQDIFYTPRHPLPHSQISAQNIGFYMEVFSISFNCSRAVSYTHLDVYKRQLVKRPIKITLFI